MSYRSSSKVSPPGAYPGRARPHSATRDRTQARHERPASGRERKPEAFKHERTPSTDAADPTDLRKLLHVVGELQKIDVNAALSLYQALMKKTENEEQIKSEEKYLDALNERMELKASTTATRDREELQEQFNALLNEKEKLEEANKKLEGKCKENERLHTEMQRLETKNDQYKNNLKRKEEELKKAQSEKDDALKRLSKEIGFKMTDNNPSITDLSDPNRAMKLGERYSEIYDNEWTDAMEILTGNSKDDIREKSCVQNLHDILRKCYNLCVEMADKQMESLQLALVNPADPARSKRAWVSAAKPTTSKSVCKQLKDCRKQMSSDAAEYVYKEYAYEKIGSIAERIPVYVKKCIEVCWYMCMHDPPVAIGKDVTEGEKFDTNIYKPYTNSGTVVSYNVWPPLLLHENGPLLAKGIVQPVKVEKKKSKAHVGMNGVGASAALKPIKGYGTTYSANEATGHWTERTAYDPFQDAYGRAERDRIKKQENTDTSWRIHEPSSNYNKTNYCTSYSETPTYGKDVHHSHVRDHVESKSTYDRDRDYHSRPSTNYVQESVSTYARPTLLQHEGKFYVDVGGRYYEYETYKRAIGRKDESYA
ncbi:uncharacterized protein LOC132562299 [Ylistrum balloti]|uniref:uncharacterized protein LOC132562299 n=1 Tax=Ylistrum balloti TaxID=509963 RepID=UPI0029059AB7|nr:uncharacterized protein LOC132562299 [Ylistrum balloti]